MEFPEPLLADDGHVLGILFVGDCPRCGVGGKGHHDQPNDDETGKDVEEHLETCVVPINRKRTNLDVVQVRGVGLNPFSVAQNSQKHPPKGEDADKNGPEHEFIIENGKYSIFCYHAITLFYPP